MKFNKTYKYRIYPSNKQKEQIDKTFNCVRFLWNAMIADKDKEYNSKGLNVHIYPSHYKNEYKWLYEVDSMALCNVYMNIEKAYNNFFKNPKKFKHPKFHRKKENVNSYTTNYHKDRNNIRIIDNKFIKLPKLDPIKVKYHREIPKEYNFKNATITKTSTNKYYVSITVEYTKEYDEKIFISKSLGIDYSSSNFYIDSNGKTIKMPHFYRELESKLNKENKKLSKMVKYSNNWNKQKYKINKIYEKIANRRIDFLHKLSTDLANTYDVITLEDINLLNISQTLKLGKSTMDNGFGMFRDMLSKKMAERSKILLKVDKYYPSSKTCHHCGAYNKKLALNDRIWICPNCKRKIDRDYNAAINIEREGIRTITNNPWAMGDSSLILNSLELLNEKTLMRYVTTPDCG